MKVKKVSVPVAPASLLGGAYDSSDDEDADANGDDGARMNSSAAASSYSTAAASTAAAAMSTDDDDDHDNDSDEDDEDERRNPLLDQLPITHEAELRTNGHTKTVSALCLDRSGGRVLSGSYDYQCKMWDFGGMNETLAAFRTFEPQEGHQVRQLTYSNTGDMFLAVTGSAQPKIYTREAVEVCQFARGDMYIMDQKQTKGHSTAVTSGWWHPTDRHTCMTSGIDGTIRLWDVNDTTKNVEVIKSRSVARGIGVTATAFSKDGKTIAAAFSDGSLHLFKSSKSARDYRESLTLNAAHEKGSETSSCLFSNDGHSLFTRGGPGDHTLKQWDIRAFRQPIHVIAGLESAYSETDCVFSPDEKILVTGTSSRREGRITGEVVFIDRWNMKPLQQVTVGSSASSSNSGAPITGAGVVRACWHEGINQLLLGCSDGVIRLLYDPVISKKGVLMCVGRRAKPKSMSDYTNAVGAILTPHALPSMRTSASGGSGPGASLDGRGRKRAREKQAASMAPEAPVAGKVGVGGRAAGAQTITAYQLSKYVAMREDPRAKDPREALLAMDELAKQDPMFFGRAYKNTQPVTILAEVTEEEKLVKLTQEEINLSNAREGQQ